MSTRPDPMMQGFGAPPPPATGWRRGLQSLGVMSRLGIISGGLIVVVVLADAAFPPSMSPLALIGNGLGRFGGSIIAAEQNATRRTTALNTEAAADAAARAEARKTEQVIAAEHAQNMRDAAVMPQIFGSWAAQITCMVGAATGDRQKQQACAMVAPLNDSITAQQGGAIDTLGNGRQWGGAPAVPQGSRPAMADDALPLNQGEYYRMERFESLLSSDALRKAQAGLDRNTNRGERQYLARLSAMAGENNDGTAIDPGSVSTAENPRRDLPAAVRSP